MGVDFNSLVAEVKSSSNLVEVCEKNGIQTKQTGYRYKALCPFHQENTPSFIIDDRSQTFHCFGCGAKGDVLNFVQNYNNTEFIDALRIVGESYGIDVETKLTEIYGNEDSTNTIDYKYLRACVKDAADFYADKFSKLKNNHPAKTALTGRGLSLEKVNVYLGYADKEPTSLIKYLQSKNYDIETIIEAGLARKAETKHGEKVFDIFSNRLLFSFTDQLGRIIGFSGRKLDNEDFGGKYVNTGETPLFHKGSLIYNFFDARKTIGQKQSVFVVEGQSDVIALQQAGIENVVAISGTATTEEHMKLLNRSVGATGKIIFCLDGDSAGLKAMKKTVESHKIAQNKGYAVVFEDGVDPCSFFTENGSESLLGYIKTQQKTAAEFISHLCTIKLNLDETAHKQKAINRLVSICSQVDNDTFVYLCASDLSKKVSISTDTIVKSVKENSSNVKKTLIRKNDEERENNKGSDIPIPHSVSIGLSDVDLASEKNKYEKIINHDFGAIEARLFSLIVRYPGLVKEHGQPNFRVRVIKEMYDISNKLPHNRKMVAEEYGRHTVFASMLFFDDSLFPALHLVSIKEVGEHYEYLLERLEMLNNKHKKEQERNKILEFLVQNSDLDLKDLQIKMKEAKVSL